MGWFRKKQNGEMTEPPTKAEQCVIVHVRLSSPGFGTSEERDSIHKISEMLAEAIVVHRVGEFDGDVLETVPVNCLCMGQMLIISLKQYAQYLRLGKP